MHKQPAATNRHSQTRMMDHGGRIYAPHTASRMRFAAWWQWLRQRVWDWA